MTFWVAGAVVVSSAIGANSSSRAAKTQAAAADRAGDVQRDIFERQTELQAPFREAGLTAQNRLMDLLGLSGNTGAQGYGSAMRNFSMADFQADPGYGFRMSEGMKALERSAAARGGLLSGGTLKGIQRFGQDLASQEYQNAFNRYQVNRANMLNPLQSLRGDAQTATNVLSGAAGQYGQNAGEALTSGAAARASGYVGQANALTGGLNTYLNYQQGQNLLGALRGPSAVPSATPTYPSYEVPYTANIG